MTDKQPASYHAVCWWDCESQPAGLIV